MAELESAGSEEGFATIGSRVTISNSGVPAEADLTRTCELLVGLCKVDLVRIDNSGNRTRMGGDTQPATLAGL